MKKLLVAIYVKDEIAYLDNQCSKPVNKDLSLLETCIRYYENGADGIIYTDKSYDDNSHEISINNIRGICKAIDIPVYVAGAIKRVEDVKKYLYAGSRCAMLDSEEESNLAMFTEATNRFGKEKVGIILKKESNDAIELLKENETETIILVGNTHPVSISMPVIYLAEQMDENLLSKGPAAGIAAPEMTSVNYDFMDIKYKLKNKGISVNSFESAIPFSEFKLNSDDMIPVIVQDYATDEVLMMAYMNQESYELTIKTGRMTYFSRSRNEIWLKGLTSGHYQYVISIALDCDNDTLLAKVRQVGAACHTGAHSCFFRELVSKDMNKTNPLKVLTDVMSVIEDRKLHPKEGSYTNYLFDKGIDKILKKVGEEATEIVIAAKNPEPIEVKYEIADFLYHVMVLMVEKGLDWDEIMEELANR